MMQDIKPPFCHRPKPHLANSELRQQARQQQQAGQYDLSTLWLYRRCWLQSGRSSDWIAYLWFRRALGYALTPTRVKALQQLGQQQRWLNWWNGLHGSVQWQLQDLLAEYQAEHLTEHLNEHRADYRLTAQPAKRIIPNQQIQYWRAHQQQWQQQFKDELQQCQRIALVGNGRQLCGSNTGVVIDQADMVVRFNRCFSASSQTTDIGQKLHIWVMAPDYHGEIPNADWIIVSGPNSLWSKKHWPNLNGRKVLAVPLQIWRKLVWQLAAPPSAGVLLCAYLQSLLNDQQKLTCYGVGYQPSAQPYHQADGLHQPSCRHNWSAELAWWQQQPGMTYQTAVCPQKILNADVMHGLWQQQWQSVETAPATIQLHRAMPVPAGWLQLTLYCDYSITAASIQLQQSPIPLQLVKIDGGYQLIFRRYQPLSQFQLQLLATDTVSNGSVQPLAIRQLTIHPVPEWLAISRIFRHLWRHAGERGETSARIMHLSIARYKRAGWPVMLEKLLQTYQPQLTQQWAQVEPYDYWKQQIEPQFSLKPSLVPPWTGQTDFVLIVTQDKDGLWRNSMQSVLQQQYPHWQLYVLPARDEKNAENLPDPRVQLGNPADMVAGQWIWQLNAGDQLSAEALLQFHNNLQQQGPAAILYCDHDQLSASGNRQQPAFKPTFAPDYLLQFNYIGPAFCYQAGLKPADPDWWSLTPWLQLLRLLPLLPVADRPTQIRHLPQVLYHQSSTAMTVEPLDERICQAITDLVQQDEQCSPKISERQNGLLQLSYPLPESLPQVTLLIPTRDSLALTRTCVDSILNRTTYPAYQILLLDNQSNEPDTLAWFAQISQHPKVQVLRHDAPFNYSAINNFGVAHTEAPLIGLVNNDTEVINPDWLGNMVQHAIRPAIGCVGAKLYFADQTLQHGGVILGLWGLAGHSHKHYPRSAAGYQYRLNTVQNYSAVTAACLVMRRELFLAVGGLNAQQLTVAFNDVDLCLKVQQAGYRNLWTPDAELFHYESKSRGKEDTPQKKAREREEIDYMQATWPQQIAHDPYYNPHLTRQREDFSIAVAEQR